ncbi:MAG TPA: phosphotransferase [Bryobacteraceae bacterium]|nr:phosphotransferase [Bryobacteraceae bacterium]
MTTWEFTPAQSAAMPEHPAVAAWLKVVPRADRPESVTVLKGRGHSMVYRLAGAGPAGSSMIAKYCTQEAAEIESAVYRDILPKMRLPTLHFRGWIKDDVDVKRCWLFIEDAGDAQYSCDSVAHRALAGQWLGVIHSSTGRLPAPSSLPERGPDWYVEELRSLRRDIYRSFANPGLRDDDLCTLKAVLRQCCLLESNWHHIARLCEGMPRTLVHGDLARKNTRIRCSPQGQYIVALDWETAGWGVPAIDLAQFTAGSITPDLAAYASAVQPAFDEQIVLRMAELGRIFRLIVAMSWEKDCLAGAWPARAMRHMKLYLADLAVAMEAYHWGYDGA